jgi:hypothetical protein
MNLLGMALLGFVMGVAADVLDRVRLPDGTYTNRHLRDSELEQWFG